MMHTINSVFNAQQAFKYTLRTSNATQRINKLRKLKDCIEKNEDHIYQALQSDLRKSTFEAAVTEIIFVYGEIDFAMKNLGDWMQPRSVSKTLSSLMAKNRIYYEPKGVCLIISPWNYPFQLIMSPLISAIAAGNTAMLKPSELSPETSAVICKIIEECFEEAEVACIEGNAALSTALLRLPFDHIFFTGSTAIGKIVMEAAAKNLTSVTLELGGKSPVIVDASANLKRAAEKIAWGKLINAGQTCIAPDYVLIQTELQEAFTSAYKTAVEKLFFQGAGALNTDAYAKIINTHHFKRLEGLIRDARDKGANIVYGGTTAHESHTIYPTLVTNIPEETQLMEDEIFGPILPLIPYETLEEAISFINKKSKPLALYIFSQNRKHVKQLIKQTAPVALA